MYMISNSLLTIIIIKVVLQWDRGLGEKNLCAVNVFAVLKDVTS